MCVGMEMKRIMKGRARESKENEENVGMGSQGNKERRVQDNIGMEEEKRIQLRVWWSRNEDNQRNSQGK